MRKILALVILLFAPFFVGAAEDELLAPDDAFSFQASVVNSDTLRAQWTIADGYYLYRDKIRFESGTPGVTLGDPVFPAGQVKNDEFFGRVETYRGQVVVEMPLQRANAAANTLSLTAHSQGCADLGVCYPPHRQQAQLTLAAASSGGLTGLLSKLGMGGEQEEDEFLEPDDAFRLTTEVVDGNTLLARWEIAPGHYLYRDKFSFEVKSPQGIRVDQAQLPPGEEKNDEFFGRIRVFHDAVEARVPLLRDNTAATPLTLTLGYQGCAEAGICYPPLKKDVSLNLPTGSTSATSVATVAAASAPISPIAPLSEQDSLAASLSGSAGLAILTFFGLGLLLAFTPCVFPMIPILSSIIVGQGEGLTTRRAFVLSVVYVLAMAVTYTVAGVIAGLFGANLQATFQNPWILGTFAGLFVLLALSMFGFYELQLPSSLQSRLATLSNRQQGGSLVGVGVMGLLSALIVGPCVAPPLMGALIYIGQTGDAVLGGAALFALSLGMGAPLLAVGVSAGKFLPRAGGWMDSVKAVFGVLMLAVAIWMLERVLPAEVAMLLWALLFIVSAIYMGALEQIREGRSGWHRLWKGLGLVMLVYGALLLIGSASGGRDPLAPLAHFQSIGVGASGAGQPAQLSFRTIKTVADLDREVALAASQGKPVMLDFYADWCVSCKEFEKYTFSDPAVIAALSNGTLLKADVTANDAADQELLRRFRLIGPPSILFFDANGEEQNNYRVVGFMKAEPFRAHVARAFGL